MFPDVLQVGRRSLDFSALRHGMNVIIQHPHFPPCEETRNLFSPGFHFSHPPKRYCVAPAWERARRKVGASAPVKIAVKLSKLLRVKIKMRQPGRNLCRICWDGNFTPKNLKIEVGADLLGEVTPDNRVGIEQK